MDTKMLDDLKQRHAYEKWRASNTIEQNLFIWKFFLSGSEFPGWQIHRIQSVEMADWPPSIQSIWRRHEGETGALLSVDIFEHPSRTAAHEFWCNSSESFSRPMWRAKSKLRSAMWLSLALEMLSFCLHVPTS